MKRRRITQILLTFIMSFSLLITLTPFFVGAEDDITVPQTVDIEESETQKEIESQDNTTEETVEEMQPEDNTNPEESTEEESSKEKGEKPSEETKSEEISEEPQEEKKQVKTVQKKTLTYETDDYTVKAVVKDKKGISTDARLEVTPITYENNKKTYQSYMSALKVKGSKKNDFTKKNTLLYDVTIYEDDKEYEPEDGDVTVTFTFKNDAFDQIGASSNEDVSVIHLPVKNKKIKKEIVDANVSYKKERVTFTLDSLSTIAVSSASTTVTIKITLDGAPAGYTPAQKLYLYLIPDNDNNCPGQLVEFVNGEATVTFNNLTPDNYDITLAYRTDNQAMQLPTWTKNNMIDQDVNRMVKNGGYFSGFIVNMPETATVTGDQVTYSIRADLPDTTVSATINSLMDHAINYGIVANKVVSHSNYKTNFATKELIISNASQGDYGNRVKPGDTPANVIASINADGNQQLNANNYTQHFDIVEENRKDIKEGNSVDARLQTELEDKIELLITRTLNQCDNFVAQGAEMLTLPKVSTIDTTAYKDDDTIVLDATKLEGTEPITIRKKPDQTIIFNLKGTEVKLPGNIKVIEVEDDGTEVSHKSIECFTNCDASEADTWKHIIWNCVDATKVETSGSPVGGIILAPKGDVTVNTAGGGGWIVARGTVEIQNQWYAFPASDITFKKMKIVKDFIGVTRSEVEAEANKFYFELWTSTNSQAQGTTNKYIETLVLKEGTQSNPQEIGYYDVSDLDGGVRYTWYTDDLAVGNNHTVTEYNVTVDNKDPVNVITAVRSYILNPTTHLGYWDTIENEGADLRTARFTVGQDDENDICTFTNEYVEQDFYNLTVNKEVDDLGHNEVEGTEYTFKITLLDEDGNIPDTNTYEFVKTNKDTGQTQTASITLTKQQGECSGQFTLTSHQNIFIKNIPKNWTYHIEEINVDEEKYTPSYDSNQESQMKSNKSTTITNTYPQESTPITIKKTFSNLEVIDIVKDGFEITLNGQETYKFKLDDADVTRNKNVFTWTREIVLGDYTVAESNYNVTNYNMSQKFTVGTNKTETNSITVVKDGDNLIQIYNDYVPIIPDDKVAGIKNYYDKNNEKQLLDNNQFTFKLTNIANGSITYTTGNKANGLIVFDDESLYDESGEYYLQEVIGEDPDVDYDDTVYKVVVDKVDGVSVTATITNKTKTGNTTLSIDLTLPVEDAGRYILHGSTPYYWKDETTSGSTVTFHIDVQAYMAQQANAWTLKLYKENQNEDGYVYDVSIPLEFVDWSNPPIVGEPSIIGGGTQSTLTITYYDDEDNELSKESVVFNNKEKSSEIYELPSTGGIGIYPFIIIGTTMMTIALLSYIRSLYKLKQE